MSSGHDAHGHDHGHDHGKDAHGHGHDGDPVEARDTIADFGFYAAALVAGAAILLQAFIGAGAPPPKHGAETEHAAPAAHEGH
jgi:hypothetical protein